MNAGFGGVSIQTDTVWIAGEAVHDGPACAAVLVDLKAQVIVCACDRVVMLVNDKVGAVFGSRVCFVERCV